MPRSRRSAPARLLTRSLYRRRESSRGPETVEAFLPGDGLHRMFETIGTTYDVQNRILSAGRDVHWRHVLGDLVAPHPGTTLYDMATGTGDIAMEMVRRCPECRVIGVDYSAKMLAVAARKIERASTETVAYQDRITLTERDIRNTGLPGASADVVTITFALRNLADRLPALSEFKRVLRPGGTLHIMDFGIPQREPIRTLYGLYFDHVMPFLGNLLSRTDYAYSYLRESIRGFPAPQEFAAELSAAGFTKVRIRRFSFGLAILYSAVKSEEQHHEDKLGGTAMG